MMASAMAIQMYGVPALARLMRMRPVPAVVSPNVAAGSLVARRSRSAVRHFCLRQPYFK